MRRTLLAIGLAVLASMLFAPHERIWGLDIWGDKWGSYWWTYFPVFLSACLLSQGPCCYRRNLAFLFYADRLRRSAKFEKRTQHLVRLHNEPPAIVGAVRVSTAGWSWGYTAAWLHGLHQNEAEE